MCILIQSFGPRRVQTTGGKEPWETKQGLNIVPSDLGYKGVKKLERAEKGDEWEQYRTNLLEANDIAKGMERIQDPVCVAKPKSCVLSLFIPLARIG